MVDNKKDLTENVYKDPDEVLIEGFLDELGVHGDSLIEIEHDPQQTDRRTYRIKVEGRELEISCMPSGTDILDSKRQSIRQGLIEKFR
jgi:hypothetical protein